MGQSRPLTEHQLRALLAGQYSRRVRDPERIDELRRQLHEVQLADHIRRVIDQAPPLTDEQRERLAFLLAPAAAAVAKARGARKAAA